MKKKSEDSIALLCCHTPFAQCTCVHGYKNQMFSFKERILNVNYHLHLLHCNNLHSKTCQAV